MVLDAILGVLAESPRPLLTTEITHRLEQRFAYRIFRNGFSPERVQNYLRQLWHKRRVLRLGEGSPYRWRRALGPMVSLSQESKRMELYRRGLNDTEIAKRCGVSPRTIGYWRESRGLRPNPITKLKLPKAEESKRLRLYHEGLSDAEIAKRCGVAERTIGYWRHVRGLRANRPPRTPRQSWPRLVTEKLEMARIEPAKLSIHEIRAILNRPLETAAVESGEA